MRFLPQLQLYDLFPRFVAAVLMAVGVLAAQPAAALDVAWAPYDLPKLDQTQLRTAAGASYRIVVATPAGPPPAGGYPVIYVVDGNAWTGLVSEIIRANIDLGVRSWVEPAVVVGIGYPTDKAFDLTRRKLDFTPPVAPGRRDPLIGDGPIGGDHALMDFIDTVVKPVVQARFRINQSRQTLVGHSLGGLFVLSTLLDRPASFQTYVALSPSIWWDYGALLQRTRARLPLSDLDQKLRVFISVGGLEQRPPASYVALYRAVARTSGETDAQADEELKENDAKAMVDNVHWMAALLTAARVPTRLVVYPAEDHFSVVPAALGDAVPFALENGLIAR